MILLDGRSVGVRVLAAAVVAAGVMSAPTGSLRAQNPVAGSARTEMVSNLRPSGQPVIPIFDGWYRKADGTFDLCFGYMNLNTRQALDIPLGPNNHVEPARFDGGQPTHFDVVPERDLRYFSVFTVNVPADFGTNRVVWTLVIDGRTYSVPGHLQSQYYQIQEPDMPWGGIVAPVVRFLKPAGPVGRGRSGVTAGPLTTKLEQRLSVEIEVVEPMTDPPHAKFDRVTARWAKHRGPGDVTFQESGVATSEASGLRTTVSFSKPGDYVIRAQAFEGRVPRWQTQCCWTNAYVKVTVTP